MKALVIVVYMGPLPENLPLWLRSAGCNPRVDFLLVTDHEPGFDLPANVTLMISDMARLRDVFARTAEMPVALESPYKLNDFKPMFWALAPNIGDYDYWGFCDLDVMFGDLSPLLSANRDRFDMLLSEGHLRFLRNSETVRQAFRRVSTPRTWQDILSDPVTMGMDEHGGINAVMAQEDRPWFADPRMVADFDPGFRQLRLLPLWRNYRVQGFFWENGRVFREYWHRGRYGRDEFLYAHIQKRRLPVNPACLTAPAIDITPAGYLPRDAARTSVRDIGERNPWHLPNRRELAVLARTRRDRLLGRASVFQPRGSLTA